MAIKNPITKKTVFGHTLNSLKNHLVPLGTFQTIIKATITTGAGGTERKYFFLAIF